MKKLSFEEFTDWALKALPEMLEKTNCRVGDDPIRRIDKLGVSYTALHIARGEHNYGPMINLNDLYDKYLNEDMPLKYILRKMVTIARVDVPPVNMAVFNKYDEVKTRLFIRVSSKAQNEILLDQVPYTDKGDFIITAHVRVNNDEGQLMSVMVTNDMIDSLKVSPGDVMAEAMCNGARLFPAVMKRLSDFVDLPAYDDVPEEEKPKEFMILTNQVHINGASVFFYPGMMQALSERLGGDYYMVPSSIHEVLLLEDTGENGTYKCLSQIVREVNRDYVEPEEQLSDVAYHYDHTRKALEPVETWLNIRT